jgi:methylenetetrahydrofolate dehydrogenase (NADP+) / methenyltetrahydrofolate cyclohydrolase
MIVFGKPIADSILAELKQKIKEKKLHPHLAIILAGDDPASRIYIKYKIIEASEIGVKITVYEFTPSLANECLESIQKLNLDTETHGIIVQLPIYSNWVTDTVVNSVIPTKDVDGFLPESPFTPATGDATWEMIKEFAKIENVAVEDFLKDKQITILGKGKTAGKPAADVIRKNGFEPTIVDSKTTNPDDIIKKSDLIISATGKKHIITGEKIKKGAYVIGIGVGKETIDGKERIFGDVEKSSIEKKAKLFCPTIGGIGPLTIACLLRNVVTSSESMRRPLMRSGVRKEDNKD